MNTKEQERYVLGLAKPLIYNLYGEFDIIEDQVDKPDAAIYVKKPKKTFGRKRIPFNVGIEITTVDKENLLAYLNDKKFGRDKIIAQITDLTERGLSAKQPNKKITQEISPSYIYDGAIKKLHNYSDYAHSGSFREIILLCFSDVVCLRGKTSADNLSEHTNFLLSKEQFPYDKVLFVGLRDGEAVRVYDKRKPLLKAPPSFKYKEKHITISHGPILSVGKTHNLIEILQNDPLIPPKGIPL